MLGPLTYGALSQVPAAGGWWTSGGATGIVAAYQPKGAASLAASYINLANPGTNDAAPGTAPTWDTTNGWIFNGSTQHLTTGIVPTGSYTMLVRFTDGATLANEVVIGIEDAGAGGNRFCIYTRTAFKNYFLNYGFGASPTLETSGVLGMAGKDGYYNGSFMVTCAAGAVSTVFDIYIGGANNGAGSVLPFPGKIQAAAIYDNTLSSGQMAAVSDAMAAL